MGLDVGDKTIGVAVSDELGFTSQPVTVIARTASIKKDIGEIRRLVEEYGVEKIVVGLPLMLDGSVGVQAEKVEEFARELARRLRAEIVMWDERLSTSEVERVIAELPREKRKQVVDKLAAAVILQSYLNGRHG
ncbi:MAG: Holliday junction resolvase RuvX [Armatimonadota bacterium]